MSPFRPLSKSLSQWWEKDFDGFAPLRPRLGEACPELVEGGVGDEGNAGFANMTCSHRLCPNQYN